jgi:uncharacterized membrane protein YjgN (DUF898 family)
MADIGANAAGWAVPRWLDTVPWAPSESPSVARERASPAHRHVLEFTGSGSEYFRIWIVNLLATLVTLGLYHPWAKARRLRWFHNNTRLGGRAFDFDGRPRQMLRGFLLVGALFAAYNLASEMSRLAGAVGLLAWAVLGPALWRSALRFRLGHTRWSGLHFAFEGSLGGAYAALAGPALAALAAFGLLTTGLEARPDPLAFAGRLLLVAALVALVAPAAWHAMKRYQQGHVAFADRRSEWRATRGEAYGLWARAAGVALAGCAVLVAVGFARVFAAAASGAGDGARPILLPALLAAAAFVLVQALPGAYLQARMQDLVWSRTAAAGLRFESRLSFPALLRLRLRNLLLLVLTLGLYWPWAAVATARLRLAAVTVLSDEPLERLVGTLRAAAPAEASGDAAADLAGLDFGL